VIEFATPSKSELRLLVIKENLAKARSRKDWALDVLELVQARPDEWLKLVDKENGANATRYLKPLGIKYSITNIEPNGFATIFVKWETKA
jgi:hypothetical protein